MVLYRRSTGARVLGRRQGGRRAGWGGTGETGLADPAHLRGERHTASLAEDSGWAQIIPDPDEPIFHIYAEGATREDSQALEAKYRAMLEGFVAAAI